MPKLQSTPRGLLKRPRTVFKPVFSVTRRDSSGKKVSTVNLNTGVKRITVDLDPQFIWTPQFSKEKGGVGTRVWLRRTLLPTPPFSLICIGTGRSVHIYIKLLAALCAHKGHKFLYHLPCSSM